ncbi:MAG TPA: HepT-like ribonuclease domain-containing protein [Thermoanaerobaculia bacterium]|nr:HepT-like ribonuclease domain-containing protein [Thermoanaerobaculia bacterium]
MRLEAKKYLFDIQRALQLLRQFSAGGTYEQYTADALLRSAVERQFEVIGEALGQLLKLEPSLSSRISEYQRIIAFRNILIHGYADVDDQVVWGVIESKLPVLVREIEALVAEA